MTKLTVIVTFYNNSKYLKNTIKNIKKISEEIEVLVFDDGSNIDESNTISHGIQTLKRKNTFYYRNEKNEGAGFTKNKAVQHAHGEYIIFLDSDDFVDDKYYQSIVDIIKKTKADIVCTNISTVISGKKRINSILKDNISRERTKKLFDNVYEIKDINVLGNMFSASACNKAIKKELLLKYRFMQNKCDDLTAIIPSVCEAKKIVFINDKNYYYCQTDNSLTRNNNISNYLDSIDSLFETFNILYNASVNEAKIEIFYANNMLSFIYYSIFNNSLFNCYKLASYLSKKIDSNNFADYLTIYNQYTYRLSYWDDYFIKLLSLIQKRKIITFKCLVFYNRIKYKIKKVGGKI